jgi:hypothetical protein
VAYPRINPVCVFHRLLLCDLRQLHLQWRCWRCFQVTRRWCRGDASSADWCSNNQVWWFATTVGWWECVRGWVVVTVVLTSDHFTPNARHDHTEDRTQNCHASHDRIPSVGGEGESRLTGPPPRRKGVYGGLGQTGGCDWGTPPCANRRIGRHRMWGSPTCVIDATCIDVSGSLT